MQKVRQEFIDLVRSTNTCFLGGMYVPFSPGHMISELDNFLRMRQLGETSPGRPYLGVFNPTPVNLPTHLARAFPNIFNSAAGLQLIEDESLYLEALEIQMALPSHYVDVGLSHIKIQLASQVDRVESRLHDTGGPRSPFWLISQRMNARANMEWYRRRAQSSAFCPWRTLPPLLPDLASFVGADQGPLALLHARTGPRIGADNAGVGPTPGDLFPTIDHLHAKGFRIVKFGIEPCPQEWRDRGVIDYSGSSYRNFYNDICLIGAAAVALYNGTGLSTLSDVLDKPLVSYGHWHLPWLPQTARAVIVPAQMRSRTTGRLWRFAEQIAFYRQSNEFWEPGNSINFPHATHEAIVPTGEDILAAVEEALTLAGSAIPPRSALQERFHALEANGYYKYGRSRVGQAFLARNSQGLGEGY